MEKVKMAEKRTNSDQYQLRLPPGLRDRIKEAADRNGRSMNAEIITTLADAYPDPAFLEELSFADELDELAKKLERIRAGLIAEEIAKGREEVKEVEKVIERADEILKKPEE